MLIIKGPGQSPGPRLQINLTPYGGALALCRGVILHFNMGAKRPYKSPAGVVITAQGPFNYGAKGPIIVTLIWAQSAHI